MADFDWTTPVRCVGSRSLDPIPNEIYLKIFDYVGPFDSHAPLSLHERKTMSHLALVCRFFRSSMLPRIFETLEFIRDNSNSHKSYATFARSILKGEGPATAMAKHVTACHFVNWASYKRQTNWFTEEFNLYVGTLHHTSNLTTLHLIRTLITRDLLQAITTMHRLTNLHLDFCPFAPYVKEKDFAKLSNLQLTSLNLVDYLGQEGLSHFSLDSLLDLRCDHWFLLRRIVDMDSPPRLQSLTCDFIDRNTLLQLLPRLPSLLILIVSQVEPPLWAVDSTHVPNLRQVESPLSLLRALVPGRPVTDVRIVDESIQGSQWNLEVDQLDFFKQAPSFLRSLRVPECLWSSLPLSSYFPQLRALKVFDWDGKSEAEPMEDERLRELVSRIPTSWPQHPVVRTLKFELRITELKGALLDLAWQHQVLGDILCYKFPLLETFSFVAYLPWYKTDQGIWTPHYLPRDDPESRLPKALESSPFVDHAQCFSKILSLD